MLFLHILQQFSSFLINWEILNIETDGWIFLSIFSKIYAQSHTRFFVFKFFLKKIFTLHVLVYRMTSRKATRLQAANTAEITDSELCSQKQNIHLKQVWIWRIHLKKNHGIKPHCVFKRVSEIYLYLKFIDISWYDGHGTSAEIPQFEDNG